jgi:hypothetical protein
MTGMVERTLLLSALAVAGACGGGGDESSSPILPPVPVITLTPVAKVDVGSGMISPYKLVAPVGSADSLLVVTGRGETFSEGRLHLVDPVTLADLREPLDIGINGADAVVNGQRAVVVSRGAQRASLIDLDNWKVLHQLALGFSAGSVDLLAGGDVVVASAIDGRVVILATAGDQLVEKRRVDLGTQAYDVVTDPAQDRIYVIQPLEGVDVLNAADLSRRGRIRLPGEPGRGAALWRDYLLVSNRDGYLHVIDRQTESVQTIDLAVELGLDRSQLPQRGIDPGEILVLDTDRLVVANGRQSSLVFGSALGSTIPLRSVARAPGGQSMAYFPDSRRLLTAQSSFNRIMTTTVVDPPVAGGTLSSQGRTTGTELMFWSAMPDRSRQIAALDSSGSIRIVDDQGRVTAVLSAPSGQSWHGPFAATESGFAIAGTNNSGASTLFVTDQAGVAQRAMPVALSNVFSLAVQGNEVVTVGRLTRQLQIFDLSSGTSQALTLRRDRPRLAIGLGNAWAVAHDTNPDIGVTLVRDGSEQRFESFDDWFTGLVRVDASRAVTASYYGAVATLDDTGHLTAVRRTGVFNVSDARAGLSGTIWITSESLGVSHRLRASDHALEGRYESAGIRSVLAFPGGDSYALVSARSVSVAK